MFLFEFLYFAGDATVHREIVQKDFHLLNDSVFWYVFGSRPSLGYRISLTFFFRNRQNSWGNKQSIDTYLDTGTEWVAFGSESWRHSDGSGAWHRTAVLWCLWKTCFGSDFQHILIASIFGWISYNNWLPIEVQMMMMSRWDEWWWWKEIIIKSNQHKFPRNM